MRSAKGKNKIKMDIGWGGLPIMFPSKTAMNYLWHETNIIPEEEIAQGSHYRARQAMLDNVRPTNIDYEILYMG